MARNFSVEIGVYDGDMRQGDRAATPAEVAAWEAGRAAEKRRAEITARLVEIEASGVRSLREIVAAQAGGKAVPEFAKNKIGTLEKEAETLRAELATL